MDFLEEIRWVDIGRIEVQHVVLDVHYVIPVQLEQCLTSPLVYLFRITIYGDGTGYTMTASNMGVHPEYIHHTAVDGSNTYGKAGNAFPRRAQISGRWIDNTQCGSRAINGFNSTARTVSYFSTHDLFRDNDS